MFPRSLICSLLLLVCLPANALAWRAAGTHDAGLRVEAVKDDVRSTLKATPVRAQLVHTVSPGRWHASVSFTYDDRDVVLNISAPEALGFEYLPSDAVRVNYVEYDREGFVVFEGVGVAGAVFLMALPEAADMTLKLQVVDRVDGRQGRSLDLEARSPRLEASVPDLQDTDARSDLHSDDGNAGSSGHYDTAVYVGADASSGCDSGEGWDDSSSADSSSGGCEGDSVDSGGGCDGDGLDSGGGCAGDAVAADGRLRGHRSRWVARIIGWIPWLLGFGIVRAMRRRRRPRWGR